MKAADVTGFNIYRQGLRLNDNPIAATNFKDPTEFAWNDKSANATTPIQYSISAESIFGIEGIIKSHTYNPADHPNEYKKAEVTEATSNGYYFKDGASVKWSFPKEYEHFLKGFYVEKDNMPGGYVRVSSLLDPSMRGYTDKTPSSVSNYMRFRVTAVYTDRTSEPGVPRLYNYFPITEPTAPQNVKSTLVATARERGAHISWDPPMKGDTLTTGYNVYGSTPGSDKFSILNKSKLSSDRGYIFFFTDAVPGTYGFYVTALSGAGAESPFSDTVSVDVPDSDLPAPEINKVWADSNKIVIRWQCKDIYGLKGFRLFQDKVLIAGEQLLGKNVREYNLPIIQQGATYEYSMQAITSDGRASANSKTVTFIAPAISK
jgi:hypothetical protein